jgi:hypothetical protein
MISPELRERMELISNFHYIPNPAQLQTMKRGPAQFPPTAGGREKNVRLFSSYCAIPVQEPSLIKSELQTFFTDRTLHVTR